jgi:hypothetical protein
VFYRVEIEERGPFRMNNGRLASEQNFVPFVLEDRRHHAVIDPTDAWIEVRCDHATESKAYFDADSTQRALLQRYGLVDRNWFDTTSLRFAESIIGVDHVISVIGAGTREPDPELAPQGVYREGSATRIRLTSSARFPLVITDDPDTFVR